MDRTAMKAEIRRYIDDISNTYAGDLDAIIYTAVLDTQGVMETLDDSYFLKEATIVVPANTQNVNLTTLLSLTSALRSLKDVRRVSGDNRIPVQIVDFRDIQHLAYTSNYRTTGWKAAFVRINAVEYLRYPYVISESHSLALLYTTDIANAANDAATFDLPEQAQRLANLKAAMIVLGGEAAKSRGIEALYNSALKQFIDNYANRDRTGPQYVRRTGY